MKKAFKCRWIIEQKWEKVVTLLSLNKQELDVGKDKYVVCKEKIYVWASKEQKL